MKITFYKLDISRRVKIALISVLGAVAAVIAVGMSVSMASAESADEPDDSVRVPIIMYHSVLDDPSRAGEYIITPRTLEADILWLKSNGFTPVMAGDLADYCDGEKDLPVKPVVLTFDDGCYNMLTTVLPLLEKLDVCADASCVGRYTEAAAEEAEPSSAYSYLDAEDICRLLESGRIELVNHSYDMHSLENRRGTLQLSTESFEDYRRVMLNDTFSAQEVFKKLCGEAPRIYAYPFGLNCAAGRAVIAMCGFRVVFGVEERVNVIKRGKPETLFLLGRFNRPVGISTEEFMKRIM